MTFTATHDYPDDNPYTIEVQLVDDDTGSDATLTSNS